MPQEKKQESAPKKAKSPIPATPQTEPRAQSPAQAAADSFPIVGVGASAGGLEAISALLQNVPPDSGMAWVVIQHLDPDHSSSMVPLLQRYTRMPVVQAENGMKLAPDHVYMIPPGQVMTLSDRTLTLRAQSDRTGISHYIDLFFHSMAQDLEDKAIAVILSGTGTDGSLGAKDVKAELGLVVVQDPETAKYDGMPRAAIAAGVADLVLPVADIPGQILSYVRRYHARPEARTRAPARVTPDSISRVFALIRNRTKRDFSGYKLSTINRRIERRMSVNQVDNVRDYLRLLQDTPQEVDALAKDFLISVTSFFRDPEAYDSLKAHLTPLIESRADDAGLRIWVPGCATGEEAYSVAIVVAEILEQLGRYLEWHVFATDLDKAAIDAARAALYPESIKEDVLPERLERFFAKKDGQYQISKDIRERLVFAVHDIVADPPFSRMDLVSARNILIYFDADLQKKVLPVLHYALNDGGLLFLGTAESVGDFTDFFSVLDKRWKIYRNHKTGAEAGVEIPTEMHAGQAEPAARAVPEMVRAGARHHAEQSLLQALPPAVLIDRDYHILFVHGQTGKYLELREGMTPANALNLLEMAREGLRVPLDTAITQALAQGKTVVREGTRLRMNSHSIAVRLTVKPLGTGEMQRLVITFEDMPEPRHRPGHRGAGDPEHTRELEQELQYTKENLRSTIEELETANEELRSANEEYQSTNEELQSTNEELETSKEELQSVNEELLTVNSEHEKKIEQLSHLTDDMKNLLNATGLAIIFVDNELKVSRFTPAATDMLNLIAADLGRPLAHITSKLTVENIAAAAQRVLETLIPHKEEVRAQDGRWYRMLIAPYRTSDNVIAGAVISFMDISDQKSLQARLQVLLGYANAVIDTVREPLLVLDAAFKVVSANRAFYRAFKTSPGDTVGQLVFRLEGGAWNIPELRKLLQDVLPRNTQIEGFVVEREFPGPGRRRLVLNARRLVEEDAPGRILLAMEDTTECK